MKFNKEIYFDQVNGGYSLILPNENIRCNLYGEQKPKFKPNITGFTSKEKKSQINLQDSSTFYRPATKKFDGYFQFPSPMEEMFYNARQKAEVKLNKKQIKEYLGKAEDLKAKLMKLYQNAPPQNSNMSGRSTLQYVNNSIGHIEQRKEASRQRFLNDLRLRIDENRAKMNTDHENIQKENRSLSRVLQAFNSDNTGMLFNKEMKNPSPKSMAKFEAVHKEMSMPKKTILSDFFPNLNKGYFQNKSNASSKPSFHATETSYGPQSTRSGFNITNYSFNELMRKTKESNMASDRFNSNIVEDSTKITERNILNLSGMILFY